MDRRAIHRPLRSILLNRLTPFQEVKGDRSFAGAPRQQGAASRAQRYLGSKTDAELYLGRRTLFP